MMVGNPSTAKITLCTLALHSAILSPRNTIAEEASAAIDANYWIKKRDQRKQYLRRQDGLFTDQLTEQKKQQYFARGVAKGAYGSSRNGELRQSSTSIMYRPPNYSTNRLLKSCQGWHTELNNQDGCSNDLNYLDAWRKIGQHICICFHLIFVHSNFLPYFPMTYRSQCRGEREHVPRNSRIMLRYVFPWLEV